MQLAREVLDEGARAVGVGVTCDEIDRIVHEVKNYLIFEIYLIARIVHKAEIILLLKYMKLTEFRIN